MTIDRVYGPALGRSLVSCHAGLVYAVSYDPNAAGGIIAQTQNTLKFLEENLAKAGSSKANLIQATVYLHDISMKSEMDTIWNAWIGPKENWPQRACIQASMDDGTSLIEVVVIAAQS